MNNAFDGAISDKASPESKLTNNEINVNMCDRGDSKLAQNATTGATKADQNADVTKMLLGFELQFLECELKLMTDLEKMMQSMQNQTKPDSSTSSPSDGKQPGQNPPEQSAGQAGAAGAPEKPVSDPGTSIPPESSTGHPGTSKPPESTTGHPGTSKPPESTTGHPGTSKPPESSTGHPGTSKPPESSTGHPGTSKPPESTSGDGTSKPPSTGTTDGGTSKSSPESSETNSELNKLGIDVSSTVYRNDFSGARGSQPDPKVLDTSHIDAAGAKRQRGASIAEDAYQDKNDAVDDGKGNLQIFPQKQKTLDPVTGTYVDYTKGSLVSTSALDLNLKDHPNGYVIEERAKHPTAPGAKFDALWLETDTWAADPKKGQKSGDTVEFDAAEGGGADITAHFPVKNDSGKSEDHYGGGAHPKDVNIDDGQFHTYDVVVRPDAKTGRGDITEYIDGKKEFSQANVIPADKQLHIQSSLEVSPKWTNKTYTGNGGMDSTGAGQIDYLTVSNLA